MADWRKFMIRVVRAAVLACAVVTVAAAADQDAQGRDEKLGKGVTLTDATPIKALYETPEKFVGKTIRIDGVVTAVCAEMGCWMALAESDTSEQPVRLKVEHAAGIVFPISAKGKKASAEGVLEEIAAGDKEANEAASEHAGHAKVSDFAKKYHIKATGAVIKQ
jgi:hypothetical protein